MVMSLTACGDDEATPEQMKRVEARCVKELVAHAEALDAQVSGFEKWNGLAAAQRECVEDGAKDAVDAEED